MEENSIYYNEISKQVDADYLIHGSYSLDRNNVKIQFITRIYSRYENVIVKEFREKVKLNSAIFLVTNKIGNKIVQTMKQVK